MAALWNEAHDLMWFVGILGKCIYCFKSFVFVGVNKAMKLPSALRETSKWGEEHFFVLHVEC